VTWALRGFGVLLAASVLWAGEAGEPSGPAPEAAAATAPAVSPAYEQLLQERAPLLIKVRLLRALRTDFRYASDPKKGVQLERDIKAAFARVVAVYDRYLRKHPEDARAHYDLGLLYYHEGEDENSAAVHWLRTIELAPNFDQAYNSLAVHYADCAEHEKALRCIAKALELNPNVAMYHFNAATFYFNFRREAMSLFGWDLPRTWQEILSQYESALRLEPTNYVFARDYAQTFNSSGYFQVPPDLQQARAAWERALPLAPRLGERVMVLTYLARIASYGGDDEQAKKYLEQARELSPQNDIVLHLEERLARGEHLPPPPGLLRPAPTGPPGP
jgi:tetratricopeptide (TPR) repeat protein